MVERVAARLVERARRWTRRAPRDGDWDGSELAVPAPGEEEHAVAGEGGNAGARDGRLLGRRLAPPSVVAALALRAHADGLASAPDERAWEALDLPALRAAARARSEDARDH